MPPEISGALATLISAAATALLMWATYKWGPSRAGKQRQEAEEDEDA